MEVWSRIYDAHVAMANPSTIDAEYMMNGAIVSACSFGILAVFDRLVARRFKRSYFALHVFANIIITAMVLQPAMRALLNPTSSTIVPTDGKASSALFVCWVYALHIYHPIFLLHALHTYISSSVGP